VSLVLPLNVKDAQATMRNVHELDLNGHGIVLDVPTRVFSCAKFAPHLRRNLVRDVLRATDCLVSSDALVPTTSKLRYHIITLRSNRESNSTYV
jgi:hypothetical protein